MKLLNFVMFSFTFVWQLSSETKLIPIYEQFLLDVPESKYIEIVAYNQKGNAALNIDYQGKPYTLEYASRYIPLNVNFLFNFSDRKNDHLIIYRLHDRPINLMSFILTYEIQKFQIAVEAGKTIVFDIGGPELDDSVYPTAKITKDGKTMETFVGWPGRQRLGIKPVQEIDGPVELELYVNPSYWTVPSDVLFLFNYYFVDTNPVATISIEESSDLDLWKTAEVFKVNHPLPNFYRMKIFKTDSLNR